MRTTPGDRPDGKFSVCSCGLVWESWFIETYNISNYRLQLVVLWMFLTFFRILFIAVTVISQVDGRSSNVAVHVLECTVYCSLSVHLWLLHERLGWLFTVTVIVWGAVARSKTERWRSLGVTSSHSHSLVDQCRWRLATADDLVFLLHCSLSYDISLSWM